MVTGISTDSKVVAMVTITVSTTEIEKGVYTK